MISWTGDQHQPFQNRHDLRSDKLRMAHGSPWLGLLLCQMILMLACYCLGEAMIGLTKIPIKLQFGPTQDEVLLIQDLPPTADSDATRIDLHPHG